MELVVAPPHCLPGRDRAADSTGAPPGGTLPPPRRRDGQLGKGRIEAFSDGVIAIIITIMVLELRPPEGTTLEALRELGPVFISYVLSFVFVGIYWNNHHHLFQAVRAVDGRVLWANLFLLFCLSLLPFASAWMGEHEFAAVPVALYGVILLAAAVAYFVLVRTLLPIQPEGTPARRGDRQ
jgi:uncharacterized membrane protein